MTLIAVIAFILRFLPNSTDFQADYITVVEGSTLQRGLSAIAEHLVVHILRH